MSAAKQSPLSRAAKTDMFSTLESTAPSAVRTRCRTDRSVTPTGAPLSSLLEQEYYLVMVLEHLVDYGLHQCRLVCRKWYRVCQRFPVKLTISEPEDIPGAASAHPNAISLSLARVKRPVPIEDLRSHVDAFRCLEELNLPTCNLAATVPTGLFFKSMQQLRRLDILLTQEHWKQDFCSSLRYLMNLTVLKIRSTTPTCLEVAPFTELESIRELSADFCMFVGKEAECLFPSLTKLTRLELSATSFVDEASYASAINATRTYAQTLQSLSLSLYCTPASDVEHTSLSALIELKSLRLEGLRREHESLLAVLKKMHFLRKLEIKGLDSEAEGVLAPISRFTQLRSLEIEDLGENFSTIEATSLAARLTELTKLVATVRADFLAVLSSSLTQLVHLKLNIVYPGGNEVNNALDWMPHLETLDVFKSKSAADLLLRSSSLAGLRKLRSLTLSFVSVDGFFFQQLASLQTLTQLRFSYSEQRLRPSCFISQVNLLRNLKTLLIHSNVTRNLHHYLYPRHLSNLVELVVDGTEEDISTMRRKFVVLPGAVVNPVPSAWRSRSRLSSWHFFAA